MKMQSRSNDFTMLAKAKIQNTRNVVISKHIKGNYTLGQQIIIQEGERQTSIFLQGSIHVSSLEGLYNLRDALNEAISKEESWSD